jgi:hypothetical protein
MKTVKFIMSAICVCTSILAFAQDKKDSTNQYAVIEHGSNSDIKTLFGGNHTNGFYISYDLGFGTIDKKQTVETGGRIAWIIDHSIAIGFFGNGFVSASDFNKIIDNVNSNVTLAGGYGGFLIEPILFPKHPIHVSFPIELGVGGAGYQSSSYNPKTYDYMGNSNGDAFMVVKPGVELEMNMLKFFRLGLGMQYRYIYGLNLDGFNKNDLNGLSASIAFKFGKF